MVLGGVQEEMHHHSFKEEAMTTTPDGPRPSQSDDEDVATEPASKGPGVEIGMSPGEGTTFEPEEDSDAQD
jgi:hypothetical protein